VFIGRVFLLLSMVWGSLRYSYILLAALLASAEIGHQLGCYGTLDRTEFDSQTDLEVGYCRLVTITTDNNTERNESRTGVDAHWPFLSDTPREWTSIIAPQHRAHEPWPLSPAHWNRATLFTPTLRVPAFNVLPSLCSTEWQQGSTMS
jgi:hypothetical protein